MRDGYVLFHTSSNGDRWSLCRGERSDDVHVLHEPNAPSGGRAARIDLGHFLTDGSGPQQQDLLRLIGTLVGRTEAEAPPGGPAPEPGASAAEPTPGEALR